MQVAATAESSPQISQSRPDVSSHSPPGPLINNMGGSRGHGLTGRPLSLKLLRHSGLRAALGGLPGLPRIAVRPGTAAACARLRAIQGPGT